MKIRKISFTPFIRNNNLVLTNKNKSDFLNISKNRFFLFTLISATIKKAAKTHKAS